MGPESLLDNAPNVIQKRICTSNEFLAVYCVENVNASQKSANHLWIAKYAVSFEM